MHVGNGDVQGGIKREGGVERVEGGLECKKRLVLVFMLFIRYYEHSAS